MLARVPVGLGRILLEDRMGVSLAAKGARRESSVFRVSPVNLIPTKNTGNRTCIREVITRDGQKEVGFHGKISSEYEKKKKTHTHKVT